MQPVIGDDDNGDIQKQEKVVVQMPTAVVIFEANKSWSGELVETKGGAQSVGGSSRRKHRPSQGDDEIDEDSFRRDDDDRREVSDDYYGPQA